MKLGLIAAMVVILSFSINMAKIHSNRLVSEVTKFKESQIRIEELRDRSKLEAEAVGDFFRNEHGYMSDSGDFYIRNTKNSYPGRFEYDMFWLMPKSSQPLYYHTDKGDFMEGTLPRSVWSFDTNICTWDGREVTVDWTESGVNYLIKDISIVNGSTLELDDVYRLDMYTNLPVDVNVYEPVYNGKPKILLKTKHNAVQGYYILNPIIENFNFIMGYDLEGNAIFSYTEESHGRRVLLNFYGSNKLTINSDNPYKTIVNIGGFEYMFDDGSIQEEFELGGEEVEIIVYEDIEEGLILRDFELVLDHLIKE